MVNIALYYKQVKRNANIKLTETYKLLDKTRKLEESNAEFIRAHADLLPGKYNYVLFVDTFRLFNVNRRLYFIDSLAGLYKNINFIVASDGENESLLQKLNGYGLNFGNLRFIPFLNHYQSAISNTLKLNHKVYGCDLITDKEGKIVYHTFIIKKNNDDSLLFYLDRLKLAEWQKTLN